MKWIYKLIAILLVLASYEKYLFAQDDFNDSVYFRIPDYTSIESIEFEKIEKSNEDLTNENMKKLLSSAKIIEDYSEINENNLSLLIKGFYNVKISIGFASIYDTKIGTSYCEEMFITNKYDFEIYYEELGMIITESGKRIFIKTFPQDILDSE